jgi:hypothetical protein
LGKGWITGRQARADQRPNAFQCSYRIMGAANSTGDTADRIRRREQNRKEPWSITCKSIINCGFHFWRAGYH